MLQSYKLVRNEEIPVLGWSNLLRDFPFPSYFQSPKGYDELRKIQSWSVNALGLQVNGELLAVMVYVIQKEKGIKAFFSERCIIFSGPVFRNESTLLTLMYEFEKNIKSVVYLEIRNGYNSSQNAQVYRELGWKYNPWLNYIVDTTDADGLLKTMSESRRRQLKKSWKLGVIAENPRSEEDVRAFYGILKDLYESRIKKPVPPFDLFREYYLSDSRNIILVYYNDMVIGGILCPFLEGVGNYEFYIAGLDQQYKDFYPSAVATYGAMKQGHDMGLRFFDFMGGGSPDEAYGVREFKSRFGGEQVEWGRWLKVRKKVIYFLGSCYIKWRAK